MLEFRLKKSKMVAENRKDLSIFVLLNFLLNFSSIQPATGASIRNNQENETIVFETQTRIYNGRDSRPLVQPFLVYIVKQDRGNPNLFDACSGSILSNEHVLTAGNYINSDLNAVAEGRLFVWAEPNYKIEPVYGFPVMRPRTGQYIRVQKAQLPKDYGSPKIADNDIAIYLLSKPLELKQGKVETICIYDGNWENRPVDLGGWGVFDCIRAYEFRTATGNTISNINCAAAYNDNKEANVSITSRHICARLKGNKNKPAEFAQGDNGGPLFTIENGYPQQIGIATFVAVGHYECPQTGKYPGVYFIPVLPSIFPLFEALALLVILCAESETSKISKT